MKSDTEIWKAIKEETDLYNKLGIREVIDHDKFYLYSIIAHSTAIEGSTLTELDTRLLLDEGITAGGKLLIYHLMNKDLKEAYDLAQENAYKKTPLTPGFLKEMNARVMQSTGGVMNTALGGFDSGKGDFRLCSVTAGPGGDSYMNFRKVPEYVERLCEELNKRLEQVERIEDMYNLSFDAHLNLVTIHPWLDGNGRTSRLLMNYIQYYKGLIPTKVNSENRAEYIKALNESRKEETHIPFRKFMAMQLLHSLQEEIRNYKKSQAKGFDFMF
ncbi:MAG: Fic family protein [Bacteroides sp.]|nr:Fic family protein [Bacteroides sp.]